MEYCQLLPALEFHERRLHRCGTPTTLQRGHPFVTNDLVNAIATLGGAGLAVLPIALA